MDFSKNLRDLLFIDIETVSAVETYDQLEPRLQPIWDRKASYINPSGEKKELYFEKAGIFAEFGKIVTIALGYFFMDNEELSLKVKSLYGENEVELLKQFISMIDRKSKKDRLTFCAHNGKEFDYPYLCRRMLVNGIELPRALQLCRDKPWNVKHLDTLEMWKFGDRKNYTSLDLLAAVLGIETSKDDMSGNMVNDVFYRDKDLKRIACYCEKDVVVTAQVFLRLTGRSLLRKKNIHIV